MSPIQTPKSFRIVNRNKLKKQQSVNNSFDSELSLIGDKTDRI